MCIRDSNVTAPYKVEVMQYLDEIAPDAKMYGSVNTVRHENGKLYGYNTDADGFYLSLVNGGAPIVGKDLLILGAGGAARPICVKDVYKRQVYKTVLCTVIDLIVDCQPIWLTFRLQFD